MRIQTRRSPPAGQNPDQQNRRRRSCRTGNQNLRIIQVKQTASHQAPGNLAGPRQGRTDTQTREHTSKTAISLG